MSGYIYNVSSRFFEIAQKYGDCPALLTSAGEVVTYEKLASNVLSIVGSLNSLTLDKPVAIAHDKSVDAFSTILALLALGVPYACIDPDNPHGRIEKILRTIEARYLIGPESYSGLASPESPEIRIEFVPLSELSAGDMVDIANLPEVAGDTIAYIMFTSGSTGVPKGVAISHDNVLNFSNWAGTFLRIGPEDRVTSLNPMYFDNSVFDFYGSIMNGAALVPVTKELLSDFVRLTRLFEHVKPTFWFSVPSTLIYLNTMKVLSNNFLSSFRAIMFGGEGFPLAELRKLARKIGTDCELINVYGPTECTCICAARVLESADLIGEGLPTLGGLIPNFEYKIVDEHGAAIGPGEIGELVLFGPNVGLGYYGDLERTEAAFGKSFDSGVERRFYRTGDLVTEDDQTGELDFKGRKDNQIKHMGYRIELEEIEAILSGIPGVEQAVSIYVPGELHAGQICAFISGSLDASEKDAIKSMAKQLLPAYMVPRQYFFERHLPKNANGKVDRKKLMENLKSG